MTSHNGNYVYNLSLQRDNPSYSAKLVQALKKRGIPAPDLIAGIICNDGLDAAASRLAHSLTLAVWDALDALQHQDKLQADWDSLKGER